MKNSRPLIKFAQIPHSIARIIESLSNPTATALLSLLTRKTVGFGQGFVDLSYRQISKILGVRSRTITRASKILENIGVIMRERAAGGVYRWRIVLQQEEVLKDPTQTYTVAPAAEGGDRIDLSAGIGSVCRDPQDRPIRTSTPPVEHEKQPKRKPGSILLEQNHEPLNNMFKEHELKKQQQSEPTPPEEIQPSVTSPNRSDTKIDDEPLHKICLKGLRKHGVSQRIARKLCNEHSHELILSVLKTAPQRPGIQNLAAYIVTEIQEGGYEHTLTKHSVTQKVGHQKTGDRPKTGDAPIAYRSIEETRAEQQALEAQRLEQEQTYQKKSRDLLRRFKALSDDLQLRIKLIASVHLSKLLPASEKRDEMLRDKTFQRMANRTVLERFFQCLDEGLDELQALQKLELPVAA